MLWWIKGQLEDFFNKCSKFSHDYVRNQIQFVVWYMIGTLSLNFACAVPSKIMLLKKCFEAVAWKEQIAVWIYKQTLSWNSDFGKVLEQTEGCLLKSIFQKAKWFGFDLKKKTAKIVG